MGSKKHFILSSLACLSLFGSGVQAMQRSLSDPRMIVRNDGIVSGKEFNRAMQTSNRAGAIGTLAGTALGAVLSGSVTYSLMNENVKELTDKMDRLKKENEELRKKLDEKNDGHPADPLGGALKEAEIENLKRKNEILLKACKEYRKSTKEYFKDLRQKTDNLCDGVRGLRLKMWDFTNNDIIKALDTIAKTHNDPKLTASLEKVEDELCNRMLAMKSFVSDTLKDTLRLEEFLGDCPNNIKEFIWLADGISGGLALRHGIDLDKD